MERTVQCIWLCSTQYTSLQFRLTTKYLHLHYQCFIPWFLFSANTFLPVQLWFDYISTSAAMIRLYFYQCSYDAFIFLPVLLWCVYIATSTAVIRLYFYLCCCDSFIFSPLQLRFVYIPTSAAIIRQYFYQCSLLFLFSLWWFVDNSTLAAMMRFNFRHCSYDSF